MRRAGGCGWDARGRAGVQHPPADRCARRCLRLSQAGLVEADPGRTTEIDPRTFAHCREIAAELYALAARKAVTALDDARLEQMAQTDADLQRGLDARDPKATITADDAFHTVPMAASGNPLIAAQPETVTPYLRRGEHFHFGTWSGARSPGQHEEILEALRAGNGEHAAVLTRKDFSGLEPPQPQATDAGH